MTREQRRAKILEVLQEGMKNPTGRDPKTNQTVKDKLMGELLVFGLEELLDFSADVESMACSLREIAENTHARNR